MWRDQKCRMELRMYHVIVQFIVADQAGQIFTT